MATRVRLHEQIGQRANHLLQPSQARGEGRGSRGKGMRVFHAKAVKNYDVDVDSRMDFPAAAP